MTPPYTRSSITKIKGLLEIEHQHVRPGRYTLDREVLQGQRYGRFFVPMLNNNKLKYSWRKPNSDIWVTTVCNKISRSEGFSMGGDGGAGFITSTVWESIGLRSYGENSLTPYAR